MACVDLLDDRMICDAELVRLLGWADGSPAVMRCNGKLPFPFYRVGKRGIRYKLSEIEQYLESQKVEPKQGE